MRFKDLGYIAMLPVVTEPVVVLLVFPEASRLPSGYYLLSPDNAGGTKHELLDKVTFDPRTAKAYYIAVSEYMKALNSLPERTAELLKKKGIKLTASPSEMLVAAVMEELDDVQ